jgi:protease I
MIGRQLLKGRRIAVLAADGVEKVELTVPVRALRAAGASVDIVSLRPGRIRSMNLHEPAARIRVDRTLAQANPAAYHGLLIPGGFINPDLLRQSAAARAFVRAFDSPRAPIATLCHGPWLLASAGLTNGRTLTSWPGIRDDLVNAGATWLDQEVVRDGNWLSSRGPQDLPAFVRAMTELFSEGRAIPGLVAQPGQSSPQRQAPPDLAISAMKWLPRPSLRAAVGVAAVAAGLLAAAGQLPTTRRTLSRSGR